MSTETQEQIPFHVAVFEDPDMTPEQKIDLLKMCLDHYWQLQENAVRAISIMQGAFSVIEKACRSGEPAKVLTADIPAICGVALRATEQAFGYEINERRRREATKQTQEPQSAGA